MIANTSDSLPPSFVYDSARDPGWKDDGFELDVLGFVERRLLQGASGRVEPRPKSGASEGVMAGRKALF